MKVNRVHKTVRPMRVWFRNFRKLMNDVFNPEQSTHKWMRYPMYAINEEHKQIILSGLMEELNQEIEIKSYDIQRRFKQNRYKNMRQEYEKLRDDLEYYYELDLNNCGMNHKSWINEITLLMTDKDYKNKILKEIKEYKQIRIEL